MAQRQVLFSFSYVSSCALTSGTKARPCSGHKKSSGYSLKFTWETFASLAKTTVAGARCNSANVTQPLQVQGEFKDRKRWLNIDALHKASSPKRVAVLAKLALGRAPHKGKAALRRLGRSLDALLALVDVVLES